MAKRNQTQTAGASTATGAETNIANAAADSATSVAGVTKPRSGGRKAGDPQFIWDEERDITLMLTVLKSPGQLTADALVDALKDHPAFQADANLLTREKIRLRVGKLSARSEEMGLGKLSLRRSTNTGYSPDDVIKRAFAAAGQSAQVRTGHQEQPQIQASAPVVTSTSAPVAVTQNPGDLIQGGLIPIG